MGLRGPEVGISLVPGETPALGPRDLGGCFERAIACSGVARRRRQGCEPRDTQSWPRRLRLAAGCNARARAALRRPGRDTPTQHLVTGNRRSRLIWCVTQLVRRPRQGRRGNREPGANPGLPRSGKWERPPSAAHRLRSVRGDSTGVRGHPISVRGAGKRRPVGGPQASPPSPKTCQRTAPAGCGGPRSRGTTGGLTRRVNDTAADSLAPLPAPGPPTRSRGESRDSRSHHAHR